MTLSQKISHELFSSWTKLETLWLSVFLIIQISVFFYQPDSVIGTIAGITGLLCVVFVGKGKISNYFWGLIFAYTYAYTSFSYQLYGEMIIALAVYLPAQFVGYFMWEKNMNQQNDLVEAKKLSLLHLIIILIIALIGTAFFVWLLHFLNSALPFLDGLNMVLIILAQIMMILRYREQWVLWIIVNVMQIALWTQLHLTTGETSFPILLMTCLYLLNSVYGYYNWRKLTHSHVISN